MMNRLANGILSEGRPTVRESELSLPQGVLRESDLINFKKVMSSAAGLARKMSPGVGLFTDDDLINTHPSEMTDQMLQAAQLRINEDQDFADRYRAGTNYTSKVRRFNF